MGQTQKSARLSDIQLHISYSKILSNLHFINEEIIPEEIWLSSESLMQQIDIDDIDFVALTKFLKAHLWTGDKVLYNGLKQHGFTKVFSTKEMVDLKINKRK